MVVEGEEGSLGTRPTHAPLLGFSGDSSVLLPLCRAPPAEVLGFPCREIRHKVETRKEIHTKIPATGSEGCCDAPGLSVPLRGGEITSRCAPLIIDN